MGHFKMKKYIVRFRDADYEEWDSWGTTNDIEKAKEWFEEAKSCDNVDAVVVLPTNQPIMEWKRDV